MKHNIFNNKFFRNCLMALGLTIVGSTHLSAYLDEAVERQILISCTVPYDLRVKLDTLFNNDDVYALFAIPSIWHKMVIQPHWPGKMKPDARADYERYSAEIKACEDEWAQQFRIIREKYKLRCVGREIPNTSVFFTDELQFPNVVVKAGLSDWPSYPSICTHVLNSPWQVIRQTTTPYENVSRVFYSEKIRSFIKTKELKQVFVPKQFLYPLPVACEAILYAATKNNTAIDGVECDGQIYPHINDDNYVVVAERINDEYFQTIQTFKNIVEPYGFGSLLGKAIKNAQSKKSKIGFDDVMDEMIKLLGGFDHIENLTNYVLPQYVTLLLELIQVIRHAGLWSFIGEESLNIFIFEDTCSRIPMVGLFDLKKPGLSGSEDPSFFHNSPVEIARNAECGLKELVALLIKVHLRDNPLR